MVCVGNAARHIGTALIIAGLLGFLLERSIGYIDATPTVLLGFFPLLFGTTEKSE